MAEPPAPPTDLLTKTSDALRGDRTNVSDLLAGIKQRAEERARERFARDAERLVPGPPTPTAPAMPAAPAKPIPSPRLDPDWPVDLRLEGGKRVRATVVPGIARKKDVADLARVTDANNQRTFNELNRQRKAIARLRKAQAKLARQVTALQQQSDQAMVRVLDGIRGFEQQFKAVQTQNQHLVTSLKTSRTVAAQQRQELRTLTVASHVQTVNAAVSSVQAAAYGERGNIFGKNNLILAGNQIFWGFLGPVLQGLGLISATSASIVGAVAPVGSITVGQVALGNQQHERFVSGVATFDGQQTQVRQSLEDSVATGFWPSFQTRTGVPVTLSQIDFPTTFLVGRVNNGFIEIESRFEQVPPAGRVGWTVDLGADVG